LLIVETYPSIHAQQEGIRCVRKNKQRGSHDNIEVAPLDIDILKVANKIEKELEMLDRLIVALAAILFIIIPVLSPLSFS